MSLNKKGSWLLMPNKNQHLKKISSRKIATTIYLTEEQLFLLKELSIRSKVPIAEYIRQGVNVILRKHRYQLPGQLCFVLDDITTTRRPKQMKKG